MEMHLKSQPHCLLGRRLGCKLQLVYLAEQGDMSGRITFGFCFGRYTRSLEGF